jgi:hypothetical protein
METKGVKGNENWQTDSLQHALQTIGDTDHTFREPDGTFHEADRTF